MPLIEEGDKKDEGEGEEPELPPAKKPLPPPPFILGEGLPVVPPKLVAKIQRGEYIDMAELLKDNIEAERRRSASAGGVVASILASTRPIRREIPDLLGWIQCFGTYANVLAEAHPNITKGLWAYQTFIVREARRCGGRGWQEYDAMFRQQQASAADLKWGSVNSALYAVKFAAPNAPISERGLPRGTVSSLCKYCQESDHLSADCALAVIQGHHPQIERPSSRMNVDTNRQTRGSQKKAGPLTLRPCYSWNSGRCTYGTECRFNHICSVRGCNGPHRATECRMNLKQAAPERRANKDS